MPGNEGGTRGSGATLRGVLIPKKGESGENGSRTPEIGRTSSTRVILDERPSNRTVARGFWTVKGRARTQPGPIPEDPLRRPVRRLCKRRSEPRRSPYANEAIASERDSNTSKWRWRPSMVMTVRATSRRLQSLMSPPWLRALLTYEMKTPMPFDEM